MRWGVDESVQPGAVQLSDGHAPFGQRATVAGTAWGGMEEMIWEGSDV